MKASWYGKSFHGRRSANGEIFNQYKLTAAHKTLPFNTLVKVTTQNGRSVVVRITDRGPYVRGRGIDLSYAAASQLKIIRSGVAHVKLEILTKPTPVPTRVATPIKTPIQTALAISQW